MCHDECRDLGCRGLCYGRLGFVCARLHRQPTSAPAPSNPIIASIPQPLSKADAALYREIFAAQEKGSWRRADRLIKKLSNRLLLGHVQAQRYLHRTHYRSRYPELAAWLKDYAEPSRRAADLQAGAEPQATALSCPPATCSAQTDDLFRKRQWRHRAQRSTRAAL